VQQKSTEEKILAPHFLNCFLTWKTRYCRRLYRTAITIPEIIYMQLDEHEANTLHGMTPP
jgi:hypothetical protein